MYKKPNYKKYTIISLLCFLMGILSCSIQQGWIIIRYPSYEKEISQNNVIVPVTRKRISLIYWQHDRWYTEQTELLWSENLSDTLYYLINSWLSLLDEESIMKKKVSLQTALLSSSGQDVYLSFDRNPLEKEDSTYEKWMWIEGLLKTIRDNNIKLNGVIFLVHHQPMTDRHLDFTNPWPIIGFLGK